MLLPLACLKRYYLKVLQRLSEFCLALLGLKASPKVHRVKIQCSLHSRALLEQGSELKKIGTHCDTELAIATYRL